MKAILLLANGQIFEGESLGLPGTTIGEVVFATGMVGFEETLTDPSYYGQIITQTYPLIGNYGMNSQDKESGRVWARGYIVREACTAPSNFRCEMTLDAFLKDNGVVGIQGLDTRRLTRVLRESGVMNGVITTEYDKMDEAARADLMARIQGYAVTDAVVSVTCEERTEHNIGGAPHVALLDFGCKANILRCLVKRGCHVTVLPSTVTSQPSCFNISKVSFTSDISGQSWITLFLPLITVAARIGSTVFFAPGMRISPSRFRPPATIILLIDNTSKVGINSCAILYYADFEKG